MPSLLKYPLTRNWQPPTPVRRLQISSSVSYFLSTSTNPTLVLYTHPNTGKQDAIPHHRPTPSLYDDLLSRGAPPPASAFSGPILLRLPGL